MSTFRHKIQVGDPTGQRFEEVETLVDTGATFTTLPASELRRLNVEPVRTVRLRMADGRVTERPLGETKVRVEGQTVTTLVVFAENGMPSLLGVYTLEAALLAVDPAGQRLIPTEGLLMCVASSMP